MAKQISTNLAQVLAAINKQYGVGTIAQLKDKPPTPNFATVSTGSIGVDAAIGVGGLPLGRMVEVYGPESSGKTTLCLQALADAQNQGFMCAFIDAEHALDINYAKALGVDTDNLILTQPDYGEQALDVAKSLIESGEVKVIVVDSVAALVPKAELEGDIGDSHMGLHARLMSQSMRMLAGVVYRQKALVIFINQIRMKIGVMFGSPETTTGGNALKFYASVRLDVRRIGKVKAEDGSDTSMGNRTRVKVVKNKVSPPFREAEFDLIYGRGVCRATECFELGVALNVIAKRGAWFSFGVVSWQGKPKAVADIRGNSLLSAQIEGAVREKMAAGGSIVAQSDSVILDKEPVRTGSKMSVAPGVDVAAMAAVFVTPAQAPESPATPEEQAAADFDPTLEAQQQIASGSAAAAEDAAEVGEGTGAKVVSRRGRRTREEA